MATTTEQIKELANTRRSPTWEKRMLQPRHSLELGGQRVLASRANRTYLADRVCEGDGCDTRLSIYNGSTLCWQHEPLRICLPRGQRKRQHAA